MTPICPGVVDLHIGLGQGHVSAFRKEAVLISAAWLHSTSCLLKIYFNEGSIRQDNFIVKGLFYCN